MPWLINASQLDKFRKSQKNVVILDCTWYLPSENRNAHDEFLQKHIVGSRFLDFKDFNDPTTDLPNMLLRDEKVLSEKIGALGITNDCKIIFYDNSNCHTSCRALWMFKVSGHNLNQLYILDGGLSAFEKYGGKIETGEPRQTPLKSYTVHFNPKYIRTLVQLKSNLHHSKEQLVDLRHALRYAGGPEVRPGLRRGHIPDSFCFPYITMFENNGYLKPIEKIRRQLTGIGVDLNLPIVTSCGSGMTAPILNFVLDLLGYHEHALYDGSWSEWGAEKLYPGEKNLNERPVITSVQNKCAK